MHHIAHKTVHCGDAACKRLTVRQLHHAVLQNRFHAVGLPQHRAVRQIASCSEQRICDERYPVCTLAFDDQPQQLRRQMLTVCDDLNGERILQQPRLHHAAEAVAVFAVHHGTAGINMISVKPHASARRQVS